MPKHPELGWSDDLGPEQRRALRRRNKARAMRQALERYADSMDAAVVAWAQGDRRSAARAEGYAFAAISEYPAIVAILES